MRPVRERCRRSRSELCECMSEGPQTPAVKCVFLCERFVFPGFGEGTLGSEHRPDLIRDYIYRYIYIFLSLSF